MLILSHRGFHRKHKENTIDAFSASLKFGVDGIETDIRLTKDTIPILFHDRLSPKRIPINEITHNDLNIEVGYRVPTLTEALNFNNQILWNLEIKSPDSVESVIKILNNYKVSHQIIITSFFHNILPRFADELKMDCGVLIAHQPSNILEFLNQLREFDDRINTIVMPYEFLSKKNVSIIYGKGFHLFVYNAETQADFLKCYNLKIDAVITDRPDLM